MKKNPIIWWVWLWAIFPQAAQSQNILATLQVDRVDNNLTVTSWVYNRSSTDRVLSYDITFIDPAQILDAQALSQRGRLSVGRGQQVKIASQSVSLQNGQEVRIYLSISEEDRLIAKDSFPKEQPSVARTQDLYKDVQVENKTGENKDPKLSSNKFVELGGFVFEQTKTPWGQQFFQLFAQQWQQLDIQTTANILIEEVPFQGRNTMVIVKINDREILNQVLQSKYDFLEELANYAIQITVNQVQQLNQVDRDLFDQNINDIEIY